MSGVKEFAYPIPATLKHTFKSFTLLQYGFQLEPRRVCKKVTRLVPYLQPEEECMLVPREVRKYKYKYKYLQPEEECMLVPREVRKYKYKYLQPEEECM